MGTARLVRKARRCALGWATAASARTPNSTITTAAVAATSVHPHRFAAMGAAKPVRKALPPVLGLAAAASARILILTAATAAFVATSVRPQRSATTGSAQPVRRAGPCAEPATAATARTHSLIALTAGVVGTFAQGARPASTECAADEQSEDHPVGQDEPGCRRARRRPHAVPGGRRLLQHHGAIVRSCPSFRTGRSVAVTNTCRFGPEYHAPM